jgi:hypothetical protein
VDNLAVFPDVQGSDANTSGCFALPATWSDASVDCFGDTAEALGLVCEEYARLAFLELRILLLEAIGGHGNRWRLTFANKQSTQTRAADMRKWERTEQVR